MPFAGLGESTGAIWLLAAISLAVGGDALCGRFWLMRRRSVWRPWQQWRGCSRSSPVSKSRNALGAGWKRKIPQLCPYLYSSADFANRCRVPTKGPLGRSPTLERWNEK